MKLGTLPRGELLHRVSKSELVLRTGAFATRPQLTWPDLAEDLVAMYSDYPVDDCSSIADFHLRMVVSRGLRRIVHPQMHVDVEGFIPFQPMAATLGYPMLESAMNWCIANRVARYLLIHAAVVERDGCAVVLPGRSGSGKSTLCAALVCRGWRLLSDEIAIVRPSDGRLLANPRPVSLKNEAIEVVRRFAPTARLSAKYQGTAKGTVGFLAAPSESVLRMHESAIPVLVMLPTFLAGSEPRVEPLERAQGFVSLVENSINYYQMMVSGFETLAKVVESCRFFRFVYGDLDDAIAGVERHFPVSPGRVRAA